MQTHRQIAKRKTVIWQVTAVAILAAAGAAVALPGVSEFFSPPKIDVEAKRPSPPPPSRPSYADIQMSKVEGGAKSVAVPVAPVAPPPPVVATAGDGNPPPDQTATHNSSEWSYIGSIITPRNRHALVKVEGQQQICSVGASYNDTTLVTIEPEYIEIEAGGSRKKIDLTPRTLLTPNEGPKRAVAFRTPPNLGQPGGPGAVPMMMNTANRATMPNPALAAGTLEQAKAQAMAAAEAARRAQAPMDAPGMIPFEKLDGDQVQQYAKSLSDPSLDDGSRMKFLSGLGIVPGTPVDQAMVRAKEAGVDLGSEAGKQIINAIEGNAKRGNR